MKYRIRDIRDGGLLVCTKFLDLDGKVRDLHTYEVCKYSVAEMCLGIAYPCGTLMYEGDIVSIDDRKGVYWSLEFGNFGDHKFYAVDNINSAREIDEDYYGYYTFTVTDEDVRGLKLLGNTYYDMNRKEVINLLGEDNES